MMQKCYFWIRAVAYVCGLAAVLLIIAGGQRDTTLTQIGYSLLVIMFVLFCLSYVLYAMIRR